MAKKTTSVKKEPQKKPAAKTSSAGRKKKDVRSTTPMFVIVIMLLLTVIVFMLIKQDSQQTKEVAVSKVSVKEKAPERAAKREQKAKPAEVVVREEPKTIPERKPPQEIARPKPEEVVRPRPEEITRPRPEEVPRPIPVERIINARVYFVRLNERTETLYVSSVNRRVREDNKYAAVINELIKGMSAREETAGYLNAFRGNIRLNKVELRDRILWCDFNSEFERNAAGGIMLNRLEQLVYTATQFPEVDGVILTINGVRKSAIGSDGISVSGVLRR